MDYFPLRSRVRQGRLLSSLLFSIRMEILANAIKQEKKITQTGKDKIKLFLAIDNMIIYVKKSQVIYKNKQTTTKNLLELITEFSKVAG